MSARLDGEGGIVSYVVVSCYVTLSSVGQLDPISMYTYLTIIYKAIGFPGLLGLIHPSQHTSISSHIPNCLKFNTSSPI